LPDNPYFYLASLLAAYVDQSPLWKQVTARLFLNLWVKGGHAQHNMFMFSIPAPISTVEAAACTP
jgi:hypothetical protein